MTNDITILNKNIPLMFLFALGLQFVYFISFITELDNKILNNEKELLKQDARLTAIEASVQGQEVSLARIDENINHIRKTVDKVMNGPKSK
jgi:hypothetical protein